MPVSTPEVGCTVATLVVLLDQVPPVVELVSVVVAPWHTMAVPDIPAGDALTVTFFVTDPMQPAPVVTVYVIVAVPAPVPVTTPDVPTVATGVLLLLHVPPDVASESVMADPVQTFPGPDMAAMEGRAFTVTTAVAVAEHPKELETT